MTQEHKTYEELLEGNARSAAMNIGEYLRGERKGGDDIPIASVAISQFHRFLATKGAYKSLAFQIARTLAKDGKQLRSLIKQENNLLTK